MTPCRVLLRSSAFFFLAIAATHVPACEYGTDSSAVSVRLRPLPAEIAPAQTVTGTATLDATLRTLSQGQALAGDARVG